LRRQLRTRSRKRKSVRTPGGRTKIHFFPEKPGKPVCGVCKKPLHGFVHDLDGGKTLRSVSRRYGGSVCAECLRKMIISYASNVWGIS